MKVLGNKSLSSAINIFLKVLLVCCIGCLIFGIYYITSNWKNLIEINIQLEVCGIYLSGILSLIMIIQFIKIFKYLKEEKVFENDILKRLQISYICSLIIGVIFILIAVIIQSSALNTIELISYMLSFFAVIIALVFIIFGVGLIVLREIYRKAIIFKEENELTI